MVAVVASGVSVIGDYQYLLFDLNPLSTYVLVIDDEEELARYRLYCDVMQVYLNYPSQTGKMSIWHERVWTNSQWLNLERAFGSSNQALAIYWHIAGLNYQIWQGA